jgi:hypothetical protein
MRNFLLELLGVLYFFLSFLPGYMVSSNLCHLSALWTPLFLLPQKNQPPGISSLSSVSSSLANPNPKRIVYAEQHLNQPTNKTRGVSHYRLAIFHHAKIQSSKVSSKRNQNPSRYYNSIITNLKFQVSTQAKISSFKSPHIRIDLL